MPSEKNENRSDPEATETKRLSTAELNQLKASAVSLMKGDTEAADEWLNTPQELFDGLSPLEHANSGKSEDVFNLIMRLRHGVFS